ncbi:hypothetical protein MMYC01_210031 [Madurella mycetomatis]|uniref:Uncharacterized protein n=1 Tax=Madurella mycetomatis TaxID=100816 RepID=A0A175VR62_9PEZI|nr:hypothetical protein MMYC01_210031 [Madurella mycetomatis]
MVGGHGEARPWLLLELKKSVTSQMGHGWVVDLMRVLEAPNESLPAIAKISSKRNIITQSDKPLAWTGKQARNRNKTPKLYQNEIAALDILWNGVQKDGTHDSWAQSFFEYANQFQLALYQTV